MVVPPVYTARLYCLVASFRLLPQPLRQRHSIASLLKDAGCHKHLIDLFSLPCLGLRIQKCGIVRSSLEADSRLLGAFQSSLNRMAGSVWRIPTDQAAVDFANIDLEWSGIIGGVHSGLQSRSTANVF